MGIHNVEIFAVFLCAALKGLLGRLKWQTEIPDFPLYVTNSVGETVQLGKYLTVDFLLFIEM